MSASGNFTMSEGRDTVCIDRMIMRLLRVLQCLPGMLVSRQVILFSVLFGGAAMRVGSFIVQLRGPLMIFVMRPVVIACRHI